MDVGRIGPELKQAGNDTMLGSIEAFVIHLLNGLTFEFGDDIYCLIGQELGGRDLASCRASMVRWVDRLGEAHTYAAFAGTLIGYAVSPLSGLLSAIVGKPKSAGEAFGRGLVLELIEGALSVVGQMITAPVFGVAIWSLGLSAAIAPIRGGVAAFTFSWAASVMFRFFMMLIVIGGLVAGLNFLGIMPI